MRSLFQCKYVRYVAIVPSNPREEGEPKPAPECMQPMLARAERSHSGASGMHQMSGAGRHDLRSGLWVSAKHVIRAVLNRIKTRDPSSRDI